MTLKKNLSPTQHWLSLGDGAKILLRCFPKEGARRLLIGHGNGLAVDGYRVFWEPFLDDFEVILFDARNHGTSGVTNPNQHDWEDIVQDFKAIVEALPVLFGDRDTFVVLHSMTAASAGYVVAQETLGLKGVVLFDPPIQRAWAGVDYDRVHAATKKLAKHTLARARSFHSVEQLAENFRQSTALAGWVPQANMDMAASLVRDNGRDGVCLIYPPELEARVFKTNLDFFGAWEPHKPKVPTIVVAGSPDDRVHGVTSQCAICYAKEMAIELHNMSQSNHFMQLTAPEECREIVNEFIERHL